MRLTPASSSDQLNAEYGGVPPLTVAASTTVFGKCIVWSEPALTVIGDRGFIVTVKVRGTLSTPPLRVPPSSRTVTVMCATPAAFAVNVTVPFAFGLV